LSYKIVFKKSVARDLRKMSKEQADRILTKIEDELPDNAENFLVLTGKFSGLRKFRIGDHRVVFSILRDRVLVLRIRHRRDAYK